MRPPGWRPATGTRVPAPLFMPKNAERPAAGVKTAGKAENAAGRSFDRQQARLPLSTAAGLFRFLDPVPPALSPSPRHMDRRPYGISFEKTIRSAGGRQVKISFSGPRYDRPLPAPPLPPPGRSGRFQDYHWCFPFFHRIPLDTECILCIYYIYNIDVWRRPDAHHHS